MAVQPPKVVFLARGSYRQRRMRDVARVLPVLGGILVLLPLIWVGRSQDQLTSTVMIYLFSLWLLLIISAAVLSVAARPETPAAESPDEGG